jgi:hypothetical protein
MTPTQDQKVRCGELFTELIEARIKVREDAKDKAMAEKDGIVLNATKGFGSLERIARAFGKRFNVQAVGANLTESYRSHGAYAKSLQIFFGHEEFIQVRADNIPEVVELKKRKDKAENLAGECCKELEFLNKIKAPARVGEFQAFAARMWSPKTKAEEIGATLLKKLAEQFIQSKRDYTCRI